MRKIFKRILSALVPVLFGVCLCWNGIAEGKQAALMSAALKEPAETVAERPETAGEEIPESTVQASPEGGLQPEAIQETASPRTAGPDMSVINTHIEVEAGTAGLAARQFITGFGEGETAPEGELLLKTFLTPEELAVFGAVYEVELSYCGRKVIAGVEVVDTTAPAIEGAKDITIYAGEGVSYKKNIKLTDNSGETPALEIEKGNANTAVAGDYPIRYRATDAAGNAATADIVLHVLEPPVINEETVSALADEVIAEVVTEGMTQYDQAYALWQWCRKNIYYTYAAGDRTSVWAGAYEGLKRRKGDCYVYYASYEVLLTRCGIDNMCVAGVGVTSSHWWNVVITGHGWYHCDTSPRAMDHPYKCFMQTDAQVQAYTESYPEHPNYYTFDAALYPERATDIIFGE